MKLVVFICCCAHIDEWPDQPGCVALSVIWEFAQLQLLDSSHFLDKIKDKTGLCFSSLSTLSLHAHES